MVKINFNEQSFVISDKLTQELILAHDGDDVSASELVDRVSVAAFALLLAAQIQYRQGKNRDESRANFPLHDFAADGRLYGLAS